MRHLSFRQTASATWAADATQRTDLERVGLLADSWIAIAALLNEREHA